MIGDHFDALVQAGMTRANRRQAVAGLVSLALVLGRAALGAGATPAVAATDRRCDGCQQQNDCAGRAKCRQGACCRGYWWRGDCYQDKQVQRKGWRWYVDGGELYYCKSSAGIQKPAKLICRG